MASTEHAASGVAAKDAYIVVKSLCIQCTKVNMFTFLGGLGALATGLAAIAVVEWVERAYENNKNEA